MTSSEDHDGGSDGRTVSLQVPVDMLALEVAHAVLGLGDAA